MGKIYFIAEAKYGEETIISDELYYIGDHDGSILFDNIFKITDLDEYMKAPNRQEFTQTIIPMVEDYFSEEGKFDSVMITAIDKNTHVFQWGIEVERVDNEHIKCDFIDWKKENTVFSFYKQYKVTNNVKDEAYTQWIEGFVRSVIHQANMVCSEVIITDIEESKRIFLLIDGKEYDIRTWSYKPLDEDKNGNVFSETVVYTLYKIIPDKDGSHGEDIIDGQCNIYWDVKQKGEHYI